MRTRRIRPAVSLAVVAWLAFPLLAADWPQWRYDAGRTAASPESLPAELHLQWTRRLPRPRPAWPKYPRLQFDASYEPVVVGKRMFVPSMVTDSLTALDTETGAEKWRFYAGGPVRFAPVAWKDKVCCASDDGMLYCLDAGDGSVLWKLRGLPAGRKGRNVLGNERLISLWPVRGGPVLVDGVIYFAAGIWPFEGVYIHAVDAETGKPVWSNTDSGYVKDGLVDHKHQTGARGASGLAPQGYLAAVGARLIVPCGRALPGFLDRATGRLERYLTGWGGRFSLAKGSWQVGAAGDYYTHTGDLCELATRAHLEVDPANHKEIGETRPAVLTREAMYYSRPINKVPRETYRPVGAGYECIVACDVTEPKIKLGKDKRREDWKRATFRELWALPCDLQVHIKAGGRLYAGGPRAVAAVDIPARGGRPKVAWRKEIAGTPARMLAADGKLFVLTRAGDVLCFGAERGETRRHELRRQPPAPPDGPWARRAAEALQQASVHRIATSMPGKPTVAMQWAKPPVDVAWPTTWQVLGPLPKKHTLLPGAAVKTIPEKLSLDGNDYPRRALPTIEDTLDFSYLYGGYGHKPLARGQRPTVFPRPKSRSDSRTQSKVAYALAEIDCPAAGRLTIGACASGRMAWFLDGNCIYDPNSNRGAWTYYGLRGRMFSADVSAGRHVLAVAVRAHRGGWSVTAGGGAGWESRYRAALAGIPHTDVMEGYCLVWGIGTGRLAEELARQSKLHVIVTDPDAGKADAFRRRLDAAGLYGERVAVRVGHPLTMDLPPYAADLVVSEDLSALAGGTSGAGRLKALAARAFHCLRPYGGVACLPVTSAERDAFVKQAKSVMPANAEIGDAGEWAVLRRTGGLSGSTDWTHPRGDAANSFTSRDRLVRAPLRMLWFGGSIDRLFPDWDFTHSRHPIPLIVGGRVFMQQAWTLSAADAYTGRLLWKVALPAPAGAYRSYASADDGLYVACIDTLRRLDPATGRTLAVIERPAGADGPWHQIRTWQDLLVGHVGSRLVAIDRRTGEVVWSLKADHEITDFAVGGKRAYAIDCPVPEKRYLQTPHARLSALDARTGRLLWRAPATVWVGPRSRPQLAYARSGGMLVVEHRDIQAFDAATGKPLWHQQAKQAAPYVLHPTAIVNARTGEIHDPATGEKRKRRFWTAKLRGCSHAVASEYLLTVRDGHASYFDLPSGRRVFLRGLRAGCTPSIIPADGLLNIPNFARGCSCNYAVFTSSALVPAPADDK